MSFNKPVSPELQKLRDISNQEMEILKATIVQTYDQLIEHGFTSKEAVQALEQEVRRIKPSPCFDLEEFMRNALWESYVKGGLSK